MGEALGHQRQRSTHTEARQAVDCCRKDYLHAISSPGDEAAVDLAVKLPLPGTELYCGVRHLYDAGCWERLLQ